ncbi:MAG: hypothetical protein H0U55_02460 [Rubrobacteraceae bacterium]|nr:hypothetical protein [Rubrobacteraceae bacterium]
MDKHTISPAGDPFHAAPRHDDQDRPHACYEGVVYIGHLVESEADGEEVEVYEAVPCRKCLPEVEAR